MAKRVLLAERPDLVLKLEKYGVHLPRKAGGVYEGCAKQWSKERKPPYDRAQYQALAERLPVGWEELTTEEMDQLLERLRTAISEKQKEKLYTAAKSEEEFFKKVVTIALLALTVGIALVKEEGFGGIAEIEESEKKLPTPSQSNC